MKGKRIHTDGAKEQNTKELRSFLETNGTATTNTAPNASQSNAFAERGFRQLMASARKDMAAAKHMPKKTWSFAVIDAKYKRNYLATEKTGKIKASPNAHISSKCLGAKIASPSSFLPWGKKENGQCSQV